MCDVTVAFYSQAAELFLDRLKGKGNEIITAHILFLYIILYSEHGWLVGWCRYCSHGCSTCVQQHVRLIPDIPGITTCSKHKRRPLTPSGFASRLACDENDGDDEQQQQRRCPDCRGQNGVVRFLRRICRQRMSVGLS